MTPTVEEQAIDVPINVATTKQGIPEMRTFREVTDTVLALEYWEPCTLSQEFGAGCSEHNHLAKDADLPDPLFSDTSASGSCRWT